MVPQTACIVLRATLMKTGSLPVYAVLCGGFRGAWIVFVAPQLAMRRYVFQTVSPDSCTRKQRSL